MSLRNIVEKLGGDLWAGGVQANIPAPGHSARDRSVSLRLGRDGRLVINTFAGTDWREVMDNLRDQGLIDDEKRPARVGGQARESFPEPARSALERLRVAKAIWADGQEATALTLSAKHARLRHIERALPGSPVLRHATAAPIRAYGRDGGPAHPALLVALSDAEGTFTAVEITFLDPDARRSRRVQLSRKTVGPLPAGSAVRIDEVQDELVAGEGFFSVLSGSERFQLPAWALLSTRNMRRFTPPPGLRRLVIAADRGADGEASANVLAERARSSGVRVWIEYPPSPFGDWNEAAVAKTCWPRPAVQPPASSTGRPREKPDTLLRKNRRPLVDDRGGEGRLGCAGWPG